MKQAPQSDLSQECTDCRTVLANELAVCDACGCKSLRPRAKSKFSFGATAAFIGVVAGIVFWLVRIN